MAGKNQIIYAIQEGAKEAQKNYNDASSSLLFAAPEYFMTVHIFQSIFKVTLPDSLTLEHGIRDLLKTNPPRGRKIKELSGGAKLDIILWYPNTGKVRGFIEVKKHASDCEEDIRRICYMLKNDGRFGVSISGIYQQYSSTGSPNRQDAENTLISKLGQIEINVRHIINNHPGYTLELLHDEIAEIPLEPENDKSWIWRPVCFVVEPKE